MQKHPWKEAVLRMKKMKILIILLIILIIITTLSIVILLPKLKDEEIRNLDSEVSNEDILDIREETSYKGYVIIQKCIENYIEYSNESNEEKLAAILEKEEKTEKFDEVYYLKIEQIYKIERINDTTYFAETTLDDKNVYFVINVDYITKSYNIRKSTETEYKNAKENNVDTKYLQSIEIKSNDYNKIEDKDLSNEQVMSKYFYSYLQLELTKPEVAFTILEKGYKSQKFGNDINKYKKYIENNKEKLSDTAIVESSVKASDNSTQYTIVDTYGKTYIIKEYKYTDYTIEIQEDNKENEEYLNKYLALSPTEKVEENIKRVYQLIDDKEYESVYNLLDSQFKSSNFATLEQFENYAKETFFEYNVLGKITIQEQGQNYVINVPYKDGYSSVAEKREKNFVMRLQENTDFILSFEK